MLLLGSSTVFRERGGAKRSILVQLGAGPFRLFYTSLCYMFDLPVLNIRPLYTENGKMYFRGMMDNLVFGEGRRAIWPLGARYRGLFISERASSLRRKFHGAGTHCVHRPKNLHVMQSSSISDRDISIN